MNTIQIVILVLLAALVVIGWCSMLMGGDSVDPIEQKRLDDEQAEYFARYKVKPPR